MSTRRAIPVFTSQDMTVSENFTFQTSTRYSIFLQLSWSGLVGEGKFRVQGSIDGINWSDYPLVDCDSCVYEREIIGASDSYGLLINNWMPDNIRVAYSSNTATAGTLTGLMTIVDNQDVN